MSNPITDGFREHLNFDKDLYCVSPSKQPQPTRTIRIIYTDKTEDAFNIDLPHNEFMRHWTGFAAWFDRFRQARLEEPDGDNG
jgi:hypothetical protein